MGLQPIHESVGLKLLEFRLFILRTKPKSTQHLLLNSIKKALVKSCPTEKSIPIIWSQSTIAF